ncbi:hypothetical protein AGR6A_Cc60499 [Agrobacterium sp. NCPPB 925]|nr:hypothetical protein AGR6A_Cc60499 [Agrobacterium sp. NCPPB 925]
MCVFLPRMTLQQGRQKRPAVLTELFQSIGPTIGFGCHGRDVQIEQVRSAMSGIRGIRPERSRVETGD